MARTKRSRRSYGAGEWGRNRVRVFPDPKTGIYQIEWRENGRRLTRSLKHRDWSRAKRQADEVAAGLAVHEPAGKAEAEPEPLTLGRLFEIYDEEVIPTKGNRSRLQNRAAMKMFLGCFGRDRKPETLSQRDWDRFILARRAGRVGPSGKPVADRTIEHDLTFLMTVLNWATRSRDEHGRLLLDRNPLKGLKKPKAKNPTRVVLTDEEYRALLEGVPPRRLEVPRRARARPRNGAPHRCHSPASVALTSTLKTESSGGGRSTRSRATSTVTPVTADALAVLEEARAKCTADGDVPVLPSLKDPSVCPSRWMSRAWWEKAERLAGLEPKRGRGWHSLRRKFASDLMDQPLKVLCELGGWKDAKTVLQCYQRPDEAQLRRALASRSKIRTLPETAGIS